MKVRPSALLPVLRSDAVGELLGRLLLDPDRSWTLTDLAAAAGLTAPTTTREVTRMVTAGILHEQRVGKARVVQANPQSPLFHPLQHLIALSYGPVPVLEHQLRDVAGIQRAFVYGSWAARHQGIEGPAPNDVDVLVIGDPDPDDLYDAAERAGEALHREVNIRTIAPSSWEDTPPTDPFLRHIHARPLAQLDLNRSDT